MPSENADDASLICEKCGRPIARPGEVVVRTGRVFHPACVEQDAARPPE
jgi:hypothetical protein